MMSPPLVDSSSIRADFTLAVTVESSIAPPVVCEASLITRLFLTPLTPSTASAVASACAFSLSLSTKPVQLHDALVRLDVDLVCIGRLVRDER